MTKHKKNHNASENHHEHHEHKKHEKGVKIKIPNVWMITSVVLFVILIGFVAFSNPFAGAPAETESESTSTGFVTVSSQVCAQTVVEYLNNNLVTPGTEASFVSVEEHNGVYMVTTSYQGSEIPVYASKDCEFIFLSALNTSEDLVTAETTEASAEVQKSSVPEAHAFVMSYCPYGLQFLKAYIPVIELLGDKADIEINFVSYAMHGKAEIDENTRMYCIQKEQKSKLTDYLRCFVATDDYESCIAEAGIDNEMLETCINEADTEFNITGIYNDKNAWISGTYPPYNVDAELNAVYAVRGSPTFVLNGETVTVSRSSEAIKQVICDAFITPPAECSQVLSETAEAPGIGPVGGEGGSDTAAQC